MTRKAGTMLNNSKGGLLGKLSRLGSKFGLTDLSREVSRGADSKLRSRQKREKSDNSRLRSGRASGRAGSLAPKIEHYRDEAREAEIREMVRESCILRSRIMTRTLRGWCWGYG